MFTVHTAAYCCILLHTYHRAPLHTIYHCPLHTTDHCNLHTGYTEHYITTAHYVYGLGAGGLASGGRAGPQEGYALSAQMPFFFGQLKALSTRPALQPWSVPPWAEVLQETRPAPQGGDAGDQEGAFDGGVLAEAPDHEGDNSGKQGTAADDGGAAVGHGS